MKNNPFQGCFEIALFMKGGINQFNDSVTAMWRSFTIVGLTLVLLIFNIPYIQEANENFQNISFINLTILISLRFILSLVLILSFIYFFAKIVERKKNIVKFITCYNWCSLINLVLFIPFFILMQLDIKSYDDVYPALIILSVYAYAIVAFLIRHIIDIPWELAIFVTICTLAINQGGYELVNLITQ